MSAHTCFRDSLCCPGGAPSYYENANHVHGGLSMKPEGQRSSPPPETALIFFTSPPHVPGVPAPSPRHRGKAAAAGLAGFPRPSMSAIKGLSTSQARSAASSPAIVALVTPDRIAAHRRPDILVDLAEARRVVARQADIARPGVLDGDLRQHRKAPAQHLLMRGPHLLQFALRRQLRRAIAQADIGSGCADRSCSAWSSRRRH